MSAITQRAFSRNASTNTIRFAESTTAEYQKGELINESSGGMSFITECKLKPGSDIFIKTADMDTAANGAKLNPDHPGEVRWCAKEDDHNAASYRVGVRLFTSTCALCGEEIHHPGNDSIDLCADCRGRFCSMSKGKIKTCVENYLIGNVI